MHLTDSEEQQFFKIFNRLQLKNNNNFTQTFCLKLMISRGNVPQSIADLVPFFPIIIYIKKIFLFRYGP